MNEKPARSPDAVPEPSSRPIRRNDADLLRSVLAGMERRRQDETDQLREALRNSGAPVPDELLQRLIQLPVEHREAVLREHPGYALTEALGSYRTTVTILETAIGDLVAEIDRFERRVQEGELLGRSGYDGKIAVQRSVQKELFAAASAAHATVDHARHIQKIIDAPDYNEMRQRIFGDDGLHELIIGIRTIFHHITALEAGSRIVKSFTDQQMKADFRLNRKQLERLFQETDGISKATKERITEYLRSSSDDVDLRAVFAEYLRRAKTFEAWLVDLSGTDHGASVQDLKRCRDESQKSATRLWWNALVGNWVSNFSIPPNPYNHLWKFLKPEQLDQLETLAMGSEQQIDRIIALLDEQDACNDALRTLIHRYFAKAASVHGVPAAIPRSAPA